MMGDGTDNFSQIFKYYKQKNPSPNLENVLNLCDATSYSDDIKPFVLVNPDRTQFDGLQPINQWRAFTFHHHPGFIIIANPFTSECQKYWIRRCLRDFTKKPNKCNLDIHPDAADCSDIWQTSLSDPAKKSKLLSKLRWVTHGYHHNWDTKVYSPEAHTMLPSDLCQLSCYIAEAVGYKSYKPEASIVNFYHKGSTLAGHVDYSEPDKESPIISFSFGCTAVFLMGGSTKDVKPTAVYVRSGDIVVMSGASRLSYHAVPRIIPGTFNQSYTSELEKNLSSEATPPNVVNKSNDASVCEASVSSASEIPSKLETEDSFMRTLEEDVRWETFEAENNCRFRSNGCRETTKVENLLCSQETQQPCNNISSDDWHLYEEFITNSRINVNVRQVFPTN